jgi:thiol-disulfide isomerase/thioredoxin
MLQKRNALLLIVPLLLITLFASSANFSEANNILEDNSENHLINQTAPDFSVQDVDSGIVYYLSDFRGKIVILDLFATWCPPCQLSLPFLRQLYLDYPASDLQIISVDVDAAESQATVSQFRDDEDMNWIVSLDPGSLIHADYGTGSIPTFYIIDEDGVVQWTDSGFTNEVTKPAMEDTIEGLLEENPTNGNTSPSPTSKVFIIIVEVIAGLAAAMVAVFGVYKLKGRIGIKHCVTCNNTATSKCSKCGIFVCVNHSSKGCSNCGSRQFIRL